MSVETTMYNNQLNSSFQPSHFRSRSYNELVTKFKQSITSELNRFRAKKRSYSDLLKDNDSHGLCDGYASPWENSHNSIANKDDNDNGSNTKRSRTAPPQSSPSPISTTAVLSREDHRKIKRARSLSPNKHSTNTSSRVTTPSLSPKVNNDNNTNASTQSSEPNSKEVVKSEQDSTSLMNEKTDSGTYSDRIKKSNITLPSISTVLNDDIKNLKSITPTTSLDYFDTYKPNDENWRYGLLDSMSKNNSKYNKLTNKTNDNNDESAARPVFDSKIAKPFLPPIKVETERKINFPYESNYTYLNKTYLTDVERYPEYLELAQSLVQLSNSNTAVPKTATSFPGSHSNQARSFPNPRLNHLPPLYPYQLEEQRAAERRAAEERKLQEQRASEERLRIENRRKSQEEQLYQQKVQEQNAQQYYQQQQQQQQYYYQSYPTFMTSPTATAYPYQAYNNQVIPEQPVTPPKKHTKFIPITPPSSKQKGRSDSIKSPSKQSHPPRVCLSCGSDQSPCWRPSWSTKDGQLCNSCGLRYKKTAARCLNDDCRKIPAKGEWSLMQTKGISKFDDGTEGYGCLECGHRVEVNK